MSDQLIRTVNAIAEAWLAWMWPMAWQVTILVAVLAVVTWLLRHRSARLRYALWMLVPVRLVVPPTLAFVTGWGWWVLPPAEHPHAAAPASAASIGLGEDRVTIGGASDATAKSGAVYGLVESRTTAGALSRVPDASALHGERDRISSTSSEQADLPTIVEPSWEPAAVDAVQAASLSWKSWLFTGWASIVFGLSLFMAWGVCCAGKLIRRAHCVKSGPLFEAVDTCRARLGIRGAIEVRHAEATSVPMLIGVLHKTILVPQGIEQKLTAGELEAVLVHELQHVARRDPLVNLVQAVLGAVYFFHPLVWAANRVISRVREDACDEATVATLNGFRREYGTAIFKVAEVAASRSPQLALGVVESGHNLKRRLRRILDPGLPLGRRLSWSAIALLLTTAAILLPAAGRPATDLAAADDSSPALASYETTTEQPGENAARRPEASVPATTTAARSASASGGQRSAAQPEDREDRPGPANALADRVAFAGRVLDPDGKPFAGAEVLFAAFNRKHSRDFQVRARSDAEGRFSFEVPRRDYDRLTSHDQYTLPPYVVARADGFGPAWKHITSAEQVVDVTLQLVRDDLPIRGQVINLEGRPKPNVTVRIHHVRSPGDGTLAERLNALTLRGEVRGFSTLADHVIHRNVTSLPSRLTTDGEGRFELTGVGRDRLVWMSVEGGDIERAEFYAMTREGDTLQLPEMKGQPESGVILYHPATFQHISALSRLVHGRVVDDATGLPVAGVSITTVQRPGETSRGVYDPRTVSDAAGRFRLVGLRKGRNLVSFYPPGGAPNLNVVQTFDTTEGIGPLEVTVRMPHAIRIYGRVTDATTGAPVADATVEYYALKNEAAANLPAFEESRIRPATRTNAAGYYEIAGLPGRGVIAVVANSNQFRAGQLIDVEDDEFLDSMIGPPPRLSTTPPWCIPSEYSAVAVVDAGKGADSATRDVELQRGHSVEIRLTGPDGQPVEGASVNNMGIYARRIFGPDVEVPGSEFSVMGLSDGEERTLLVTNQRQGLIATQVVGHDTRGPVTIQMQKSGTVTGRIIDEQGRPQPMLWLRFSTVLDGTNYSTVAHVRTDQQGRFQAEHQLPGVGYALYRIASDKDRMVMFLYVGRAGGKLAFNTEVFQDGTDAFMIVPKSGETLDLGDILLEAPASEEGQ